MWDLDYTSQAEEVYELMNDPDFLALVNEPTDDEINDMASWWEVKGVAA